MANLHFINNHGSPLEWLTFHKYHDFGPFAMPGKSQISLGTLTVKEKTSWTEYLLAPGQESCKTLHSALSWLCHLHLWEGERTSNQDKAEGDDRNPKVCWSSAWQSGYLCYFSMLKNVYIK